ncbi:hypothetical protein EV356DRAFT_528482 [Viridothelium virens]|uniref:Peptidase S28 n=1 Tax=Viridothelium virens TaxID=1048519 RepID=A0A6A6HMV0_VIRVR|nr:hypothetical protein EV356DRAFT_528482 [Viridothelium virens]
MVLLTVWVLILFIGVSSAIRHPLRSNGKLTRREVTFINGSDYPASEIKIPIDHYNSSDSRTYSNRYWINSKYYRSGGPVFYLDSGEQNAEPLVPYFLYEVAGPSAVMSLARRFNGLALIFEHRFYGQSLPFPINTTTGLAEEGYSAYQYLNTEQALQDPVYFANNFQPPGLESSWSSLSPKNTPWVWLGGSYPGVRGAHMRVRNPETFYATWASSAPTQAAVDMWTYYAQAERSMTRNCSADYTAVTRYVDATLSNGTQQEVSDVKYALYQAVLASPGNEQPAINRSEADALSNSDVGNYLLLPLSFYQYYGFEASVQPFCNIMETFNQSNVFTIDNGGTSKAIASESGIASTYNISLAWKSFLTGIAQIDYDSIPYSGDQDENNSWMWQYCSEYGFYQRGNPENPHTIESQFISLALFQSQCNETFPEGLPPSPNVAAPNKYGGWNINPSNIMFASGEYDPWRAYSPTSTEIGSPGRQAIADIPECGVAPPNDTVFGLVYRDMVHVSDMRALLNKSDPNHQNFSTVGFSSPIDAEPFYAGVGLFGMALEKWLPCFGNGSYGRMTFQFPDS